MLSRQTAQVKQCACRKTPRSLIICTLVAPASAASHGVPQQCAQRTTSSSVAVDGRDGDPEADLCCAVGACGSGAGAGALSADASPARSRVEALLDGDILCGLVLRCCESRRPRRVAPATSVASALPGSALLNAPRSKRSPVNCAVRGLGFGGDAGTRVGESDEERSRECKVEELERDSGGPKPELDDEGMRVDSGRETVRAKGDAAELGTAPAAEVLKRFDSASIVAPMPARVDALAPDRRLTSMGVAAGSALLGETARPLRLSGAAARPRGLGKSKQASHTGMPSIPRSTSSARPHGHTQQRPCQTASPARTSLPSSFVRPSTGRPQPGQVPREKCVE